LLFYCLQGEVILRIALALLDFELLSGEFLMALIEERPRVQQLAEIVELVVITAVLSDAIIVPGIVEVVSRPELVSRDERILLDV
jgi:hypothetical protein